MWKPELSDSGQSKYEQIREAIVTDIRSGKLAGGDQLPPQRELADALGISVGTVSRAYKSIVKQGLVEAGARRGTRVKSGFKQVTQDPIAPPDNGLPPHDLRGHRAAFSSWGSDLRNVMGTLSHRTDLGDLLDYQAITGRESHRQAGANWLEFTSGAPCHVDDVVVFNGAQHALTCALLAFSDPGDSLATERLTYAGLRVTAPLLSRHLVPVEIDEHGLIPEAFDDLCKSTKIKVLVCVPNLHNPTTRTMPFERREKIADLAVKHGVLIVEDDVYGGLTDGAMTPLFSMVPDHVVRIVGLSKTLGPGLRVGYAQARAGRIAALSTALRGTSWMASPLLAEIATNLIDSGKAEEILNRNKVELSARNKILIEELSAFDINTSRYGPHAWLRLPETWTREEFMVWGQTVGIQFLMADAYSVEDAPLDQAARLSVSGARSQTALRDAARRIAGTLKRPPEVSPLVT